MSALFRAELANLQLLVARAEREAEFNSHELERQRTGGKKAAQQEHARNIGRRASVANRKIILAWMEKNGRGDKPVSANKVSDGTGLASETSRRHLRDLANTGELVAVRANSGFTRYYMEKK